MNETRLCTIEQIEQFLSASAQIDFSAHGDDFERCAHIADVLTRFGYHQRAKRECGVLLRYLQHTSGYSRAQLTRLVRQWYTNRLAKGAPCQALQSARCALCAQVHRGDIELLVEMDQAHEDACGPGGQNRAVLGQVLPF